MKIFKKHILQNTISIVGQFLILSFIFQSFIYSFLFLFVLISAQIFYYVKIKPTKVSFSHKYDYFMRVCNDCGQQQVMDTAGKGNGYFYINDGEILDEGCKCQDHVGRLSKSYFMGACP